MVTNKQRLAFIFGVIDQDPVRGQDLISELERTGKLDEAVEEFSKLSDDLNAPTPAKSEGGGA